MRDGSVIPQHLDQTDSIALQSLTLLLSGHLICRSKHNASKYLHS